MNMKAINIKLATFSFAAMLLASCSDSGNDSVIDPIGKAATIVGSNVTAEYANQLASRVINYKTIKGTSITPLVNKARTRAGETPEVNIPANAKDLATVKEPWNAHPGNYYVKEGDVVTTNNMNIQGMTIYVKGTFKYDGGNTYFDNTNIIVMKGGKLIAKANSGEVFGINKIDNFGTIEFPASQSYYTIKNDFHNYNGDLNIEGKTLDIQNGCQVYVGGNVKAKNIKISGTKTEFACMGDVKLTEDFYMTNNTYATINGTLNAKTGIKLDSQTALHSGCSVKTSGDVYITNGATIETLYLKAANYYQDSNSKMVLHNQSMVEVDDIYQNLNNTLGCTDLGDKDGVAVIKCNRIIYNAPSKKAEASSYQDWKTTKKTVDCNILTTSGDNATIIVDCSDGIYSNSDTNKKLTEDNTRVIWASGNVHWSTDEGTGNDVIKKTECNPNGYNADQEPTKEPTLDLISSIDYNHDHDISATCVQELNGRLYMSYHTRDKKHGGCIEVFSPVENNKVTLEQYLCDDQKDLDFNHLLAVKLKSGKRMVYLPGSSNKKGAMLAYIPIQDKNHLLADQSMSITTTINGKDTVIYEKPLQFIQMNPATAEFAKKGYDENCVVYNDETNHLIVATTKGYLVYNADTYNELDKINKPGKVKHIAIGNGKIVTVYLDREATSETEAIPATVEIFNQKTEDLTNPIHSFAISTIEPNNGKNVVRVDDNKIYVCRGAAGMYVYDMDGNELWHYQMPSPTITEGENAGKYKGHANGCYVGKKYVYIAYGGFGLVVLDKETHKVVAHRDLVHSANYVIEYKGYIYVAYGQNRLQVFQLKNADPEVSY